jgi:hypothetical protein
MSIAVFVPDSLGTLAIVKDILLDFVLSGVAVMLDSTTDLRVLAGMPLTAQYFSVVNALLETLLFVAVAKTLEIQ